MPQRHKLEPWIERMILSHDTDEQVTTDVLKARVIGVGRTSNSQAQGRAEGPVELLYLSDGVVQIPAILTQSAWETLQDAEDCDCFASLLNNTVSVNLLKLQFHMDAEQRKCLFFLSVGELATTAVGVGMVKDITPCCTILTSVTRKICQRWSSLLGQKDSQTSQRCGFDLSELLGEWQHDFVWDLLQEARERLGIPRTHPASPQPSTSSCNPPPLPSHARTGWDADRVRHKREEQFTIPVSYLLIPDEDIPPTQTPSDEGSDTPSGLLIPPEDMLMESRTDAPHADSEDPDEVVPLDEGSDTLSGLLIAPEDMLMESRTDAPHPDSEDPDEAVPSPEGVLVEVTVSELTGEGRRESPWDMFTPPTDMLSASSSDEAQTPEDLLQPRSQSLLDASKPASPEVPSETTAVATGTQAPSQGSSVPWTLGGIEGELSLFPPYQRPSTTTPPSPADPTCEPLSSVTPLGLVLSSSDPETLRETEVVTRRSRKAKRKSRERTGSVTPTEEDKEKAERARSPPSWLFESQEGSRTAAINPRRQSPPAGSVSKRTPTTHSDGTMFSYPYRPSRHTSLALGSLHVADATLQWAVRYLVPPRQTDHRDL